MAKKDNSEVMKGNGFLPNTISAASFSNRLRVAAHILEKMRFLFIHVLPGDKVLLGMVPIRFGRRRIMFGQK